MAYKALIYRYLFIKSNGLFEELKKQSIGGISDYIVSTTHASEVVRVIINNSFSSLSDYY